MLRSVARTLPVLALLLWFSPAAAGLFGGTDAPRRIPVPARDFTAVVVDESSVSVTISRVTLDGEVFLFGALGKAQVTVPFEEVVSASFEDVDEDHTRVTIDTLSGEQVTVVMEADRPLFGRTTYGNYRIEVQDIEQLTVRR